jgi:uncharacterized membrane protein YvbJ
MKIFTWSCPVCGEEFENREKAKEHLKLHNKTEIVSNTALGPNQWLIWYRSEWEKRLGLKKTLLIWTIILFFVVTLYIVTYRGG